jgi:hypothetical protein
MANPVPSNEIRFGMGFGQDDVPYSVFLNLHNIENVKPKRIEETTREIETELKQMFYKHFLTA